MQETLMELLVGKCVVVLLVKELYKRNGNDLFSLCNMMILAFFLASREGNP